MYIEFHRTMLADKARNEAFYRALQAVIQPGHTTVADLGSGTGLLAFLAEKLGAKSVDLYEYSDALKLSQKLARHNHIKRCRFIHAHSAQVEHPQPVDLIVSETLGNYAYEENIIENIEDAKRFLKPGGLVIPHHIEQYIAPVVSERFYRELCVWDDVGFGLDFAPAKEKGLNNFYVRTFTADDLDTGLPPRRWDAVDLRKPNKSVRKGRADWKLAHDVTIYGFALWWSCELVPGITLTTSPFANLTHWEQLYAPVRAPIVARAGDSLSIELHSDSRYEIGVNVKWIIRWEEGITGALHEQRLNMQDGS